MSLFEPYRVFTEGRIGHWTPGTLFPKKMDIYYVINIIAYLFKMLSISYKRFSTNNSLVKVV